MTELEAVDVGIRHFIRQTYLLFSYTLIYKEVG